MTWLAANWKEVILVLIGIDSAIIPIFPNIGLLPKILTWLKALSA